MISNDNNTPCEVCNEIKDDVRFEGSFESFICDSCLNKIKTSETGILTELPTFDDVIKILYEEETKIQQKI